MTQVSTMYHLSGRQQNEWAGALKMIAARPLTAGDQVITRASTGIHRQGARQQTLLATAAWLPGKSSAQLLFANGGRVGLPGVPAVCGCLS
jgi:hypothetical protein